MKRITGLALSGLLLSGCASPSTDTLSAGLEGYELGSQDLPNEWEVACASYIPTSSSGDYLMAYEEVIEDVCTKANPELRNAPFTVSPNVRAEDAVRYLNAEKFHESYWLNYMNPAFPEKFRIVFSELDEKWWSDRMVENLIEPDLGWFSSTSEGGHCRVESTIFCPKFFEPSLTKTNLPTEFRIIGTDLEWANWQVLNSAHESVHLYQDSHEMSHWANWYIEGQATFFELAMAQLLYQNDEIRIEYIETRPTRQDSLVLNPKSLAEVVNFLDDCSTSRNGECESFKYGGGSLYHEKLVIDHGLKEYFNWQRILIERMPKGNPADFNQELMQEMDTIFRTTFFESFGMELWIWERDVVAPYIYSYFS